jgi:hypothetical protein
MLEEPFFAMLRASRSDCQVDSCELQIAILGNARVVDVLCKDGDETLSSLFGKTDMLNRFDLEDANSVFRHFGFVRKVTDGLASQFRSELGVWGVIVDVHDFFGYKASLKDFSGLVNLFLHFAQNSLRNEPETWGDHHCKESILKQSGAFN